MGTLPRRVNKFLKGYQLAMSTKTFDSLQKNFSTTNKLHHACLGEELFMSSSCNMTFTKSHLGY